MIRVVTVTTTLRYLVKSNKFNFMKATTALGMGMILGGISLSLNIRNPKLESVEIKLADAISQKNVKTEFASNGSYHGNCVKLNLENLGNQSLKLIVPAGTMFNPSDDGMQNILVTQEQILVLNPSEKKTGWVKGFCCEATDRCPSKEITFVLSDNKNPKMQKLFSFLKGKQFGDDVIQESVWCISNNHEVSNLYAENMAGIKPLRAELCKITGQKDSWYSTPQKHSVDAEGNISHEVTRVTGLIKFKALKTAKVHNEIYDATGKMLVKNPNEFSIKPGNIEYEFEIRVGGWKKGNYSVKVFENDKVIHKQEFKI